MVRTFCRTSDALCSVLLAATAVVGLAGAARPATAAETVQYTYDSLNRLTGVRYPEAVIRYTYDAAGNRLTKTVQNLLTLSVGPATAPEGNSGTNPLLVTATLSGPSSRTVTVDYATANGTAIAGSDYVATAGSLSFDPGVTQKTIPVQLIGDLASEGDEVFSIVFQNAVNVAAAIQPAVVTITDDDSLPTVSVADTSVSEGNSGTMPMVFVVSLSAPSVQAVRVAYATADGTGSAATDYAAASGVLDFPAGTTSQLVTVLVNGDTQIEPSETLYLNLSGPTGATLGRDQATGTILDDDSVPSMSINDVSVIEGNSGTADAVFTVSLSAATGATVTVDYATVDGTANAGQDYAVSSGSLTFPSGITTQTIHVPVIGDTLDEPNETFTVQLSGVSGAALARGSGVGTIINDDVGQVAPVVWTHELGVEVNGTGLTKIQGTTWDAGAVSTKGIGSGSGYVEFSATATDGSWMGGLGYGDTSRSFTDIEYGVFLHSDGTLHYYEAAVYRGYFGTYNASDRFRVGVEEGVVRYRRNGTVFYESTTLPTQYPLVFDTSFNKIGSTLSDAAIAGSLVDVFPLSTATPVDVVWTHDVGVAVSGNNLTKTLGVTWDAGAVSIKGIGSGNGYVEFSATATTGAWMAGLGHGDTSRSFADIEYGVFLYQGNLLIYEGGAYRGYFGSYGPSDRFRVAVEDGVVRYRRNGEVFYESETPPLQYPLVLDTSFYEVGSALAGGVIAGDLVDVWPPMTDPPVDVVWTHDVGMAISGNSLTKTLGVTWDAGAVSTKGIASGNGYVEFSASGTSGSWMAGLGNGDSSRSFEDIEYGVFLHQGTLLIYEGGLYRGYFGSYGAADRFRVAVEDGVVRYRRNGQVFYESLTPPAQYPLVLDASFNQVGSTLANAVIAGALVDVWSPLATPPVNVVWTHDVGMSINGNSLTKTLGVTWDAGAVSTKGIASGNGYVEFSATATTGSWMAGLGYDDTSRSFVDIEYGLFLHQGSLLIYEGGLYRGYFGTYGPADRFRVGVEDGVVRYRRNGEVFYESLTPPSQYPLVLDASFNQVGSTLSNAVIAGDLVDAWPPLTTPPVDVTWTHDMGVSVSQNSLTKILGVTWDAGAVSTKGIASGNGYVEFSADGTTGSWMAGLGHDDTSRSFVDIEYGLFLHQGSLLIYEGGAFRGSFGSYGATDRFRVGVEDGVVRYRRNGEVFYESLTPPTQYPLVLDVSLNQVGSTLSNAVIAGDLVEVWSPLTVSPVEVAWRRLVGSLSPSSNSLVKTAGGGWDSGAVSNYGLAAGNGYVEFGAADTNGSWMAGLGSGDAGPSFADIEYAIFLHSDGSMHVYESGIYRGMFGTYKAGDRFRVSIEDGLVRYRQNGVAFFESPVPVVPTAYPMVLDAALNAPGSIVDQAVIAGSLSEVYP